MRCLAVSGARTAKPFHFNDLLPVQHFIPACYADQHKRTSSLKARPSDCDHPAGGLPTLAALSQAVGGKGLNCIRREVGLHQDGITLSHIGEVDCHLTGWYIWRSRVERCEYGAIYSANICSTVGSQRQTFASRHNMVGHIVRYQELRTSY